MSFETQVINMLRQDGARMDALKCASMLGLNDWCLAAGFIRNLVWDNLHGYGQSTPLNDIDLIYYDVENCDAIFDREYEEKLKTMSYLPWSVKNQARMHIRNKDKPYMSTRDALSYWPELETAVGARAVT